MSDKPKRRWFRFHLLTAVVTMFAAGVVIWANSRPEEEYVLRYGYPSPTEQRILRYGWPWTAVTRYGNLEAIGFFGASSPDSNHFDDIQWDKIGLLKDSLCIVAMSLSAGIVSEWLIRRREGRKP